LLSLLYPLLFRETLRVANAHGGIAEGFIDNVHEAIDCIANTAAILIGYRCPRKDIEDGKNSTMALPAYEGDMLEVRTVNLSCNGMSLYSRMHFTCKS
jgi:hypothetical protein